MIPHRANGQRWSPRTTMQRVSATARCLKRGTWVSTCQSAQLELQVPGFVGAKRSKERSTKASSSATYTARRRSALQPGCIMKRRSLPPKPDDFARLPHVVAVVAMLHKQDGATIEEIARARKY